jgi:hypothetical protein
MGRLGEALEVQRAVLLNEELDDADAASTSRRNIANVLIFQRRTDAAIDLDWEGVRVCRESDPPPHTITAIRSVISAPRSQPGTLYVGSPGRLLATKTVDEARLPALWKSRLGKR